MRFKYDGAKIRALREAALMPRETLARMTRLSVGSICALEYQRRKTTDEKILEAIAHALGVNPGDLSPNYYPPVLPCVRRVRYDPAILKARRKELGLTLAQTGARAGLSLEAIHKLEGKDTARPETVRRVARALGLRPQDFSPTFNIFPTPDEQEMYGATYAPGVFAYPDEKPPRAEDERPSEIC